MPLRSWLMNGVQSTYHSQDRVFGSRPPITIPGLSIALLQPGYSNVTWTTASVPSGNLNGTVSSLDCYSTPGQCIEQYWQSVGLGLLSLDGWAIVDDVGASSLSFCMCVGRSCECAPNVSFPADAHRALCG